MRANLLKAVKTFLRLIVRNTSAKDLEKLELKVLHVTIFKTTYFLSYSFTSTDSNVHYQVDDISVANTCIFTCIIMYLQNV